MATRKEAQSKRLKRRHALGLPTGRPRKAKAAAAPAAGEHTVELDLSALDGESLAKAQEQEAANIERELLQLRDEFEQDIAQRRRAFEEAIADRQLRVRRALAAAREYRRADERVATLMARAGMPARASSTKLSRRGSGGGTIDAIRAHLATRPAGEPFDAKGLAAALGLEYRPVAVVLGGMASREEIKSPSPGQYLVLKAKAA